MTNTRKRTVIVNKRKFFTFVTAMVVLFNLLLMFTVLPDVTSADTAHKTQEVIVCSGDTLWSIATQYSASDADVRDTVKCIKELNHLTNSALYVGQTLIVPVQ